LGGDRFGLGRRIRTIEFDLARADFMQGFSIHPDGKRVLAQVGGVRYDLYVLEGFPQPARGWMRWLRHWDAGDASK
jgi:hypothetical protein